MTNVFPGLAVNDYQPTTSPKCEWYQIVPRLKPNKPCKASYLSPPAAMILEILFPFLHRYIPDVNDFIVT
jgi:hypothetical protein